MKKRYGIYAGFAGVLVFIVILCIYVIHMQKASSPQDSSKKIEEIPGFSLLQQENPNMDITLKDKSLMIEAVGTYSGKYMEDGSDSEIEKVPAVLVRNCSKQMLQIAEIELQIEQEKKAVFRLTDIPAGKAVLVLDLNKNICTEGSKVKYLSEAESYFDENFRPADGLEAEGTDGRLTLKNKTEQTCPYVYVYYKTKYTDDIYLGGITYRVPYEEIPAMTQVEADAGHYHPDKSEITNIQIIENKNNTDS